MGRIKIILYIWLLLMFVNFIFNDLTVKSIFTSLISSIVITIISAIIVLFLTKKSRKKS